MPSAELRSWHKIGEGSKFICCMVSLQSHTGFLCSTACHACMYRIVPLRGFKKTSSKQSCAALAVAKLHVSGSKAKILCEHNTTRAIELSCGGATLENVSQAHWTI